jgi:hypothetical protein
VRLALLRGWDIPLPSPLPLRHPFKEFGDVAPAVRTLLTARVDETSAWSAKLPELDLRAELGSGGSAAGGGGGPLSAPFRSKGSADTPLMVAELQVRRLDRGFESCGHDRGSERSSVA